MILPTSDQMRHLAPQAVWHEPDYHDEIWKYDPKIALPWDKLRLHRIKLSHQVIASGVSIFDLQEYKHAAHPLNAIEQLVDALYEVGLVIHIPQQCIATIALADICPDAAIKKIVIIVESGANITCIDNRLLKNADLVCESIEIALHATAQLQYIDQSAALSSASLLRSFNISADAYSSMMFHAMQQGSAYSKLFAHMELAGAHAQIDMKFGIHSSDNQYHSIITEQYHTAPYTLSRCTMKAAQYHAAQTMYHGRIIIHKNGMQSQAFQHHKALLLSEKARAYARPTLEVMTNDVQCGHGSAIGMIDPEQLWYLQSRGLDRQRAEQMLVHSFLQETFISI